MGKRRWRGPGQGDGEDEAGEEWAERHDEEKRDHTGTEQSRAERHGMDGMDDMAVT